MTKAELAQVSYSLERELIPAMTALGQNDLLGSGALRCCVVCVRLHCLSA